MRIKMNKVGEQKIKILKSGLLFFCMGMGGRTQFMEARVVLREYWGKGWAPYNYNQMIPTLSCEAWKFNGFFSAFFFFVIKFKCGKGLDQCEIRNRVNLWKVGEGQRHGFLKGISQRQAIIKNKKKWSGTKRELK